MKNNKRIKDITSVAIVAALYIGITLLTYPISYSANQFRIAELLVLLAFFNIKHGYGVTIGVLLANAFNPDFALIDIIVGPLSTLIAVIIINKCKRLFIASLMPTLTSILVVLEVYICMDYSIPFWICLFEIMGTMFIIESCIGYPLFKILSKNKGFLKIIESSKEGYNNEV